MKVVALAIAALFLTGCAARRPAAQLVVPVADMTKATITAKTKCRQKTATTLICDGVVVTYKGKVAVKR